MSSSDHNYLEVKYPYRQVLIVTDRMPSSEVKEKIILVVNDTD